MTLLRSPATAQVIFKIETDLWNKPGEIILNEIMLLAGVGFSIAAHCITFHHLFKVECGWCIFQDFVKCPIQVFSYFW